jgi:cobalt-zinc-cadmium efflux system outer membrane protein
MRHKKSVARAARTGLHWSFHLKPLVGCLGLLALGAWAQNAPSTQSIPSATKGSVALAAPSGAAVPVVAELGADQIIPVILAHNPQLRAAQSARQAARSGITTAQALANPRIDWHQGRNTARLPGVTSGSTHSWTISQAIDNPALRKARIDVASAHEVESTHSVGLTRNELVSQARLRIYQGLLSQALAAAAAEDVQLLEQVRERVRLRVESGEAARYEIIKADAEIITARERLQTARLMVEQRKIQLNQLAAGQLPEQWQLLGDLRDAPELLSLSQLHQLVEKHNPELNLLQAELAKARAGLRGAESSRWPGVELRYSQSQDPELRHGQWGVGVQIPLLDRRTGPIAQASAELERAQIRLEGRKAELQQQVLLTWKSLEMARLRIEALSQGSVREAEAALRVAQAAYRFGERGILDVLDAQRVLRSVRADLIEARYQLQEARVTLDQLIGQNIEQSPS